MVISDFNQVDIATDHFPSYLDLNSPVREAGSGSSLDRLAFNSLSGCGGNKCFHLHGVLKGLDALKHFRSLYLVFLALGVSLPLFAVMAQDATIVGTVTDPSGAAVPNVKITVTNLETSLVHTAVTSDSGQYVLPELKIGHYDAKAEASGFKIAEQKGVVLQVGDRARIDFQMQLGGAQETVTVEANAIRVQSDSGEQSNVITGQQISQIAVAGRSMYQLAALTPGASSAIGAGGMSSGEVNTPVGGDASVEFNGMRQNHNIYLLDGGEDDDRGGAGGMSIAPSSDAIAEFRALTSNYSADYGLSSGGTMTMVLKSGSSTLHASAWEFNRNDALDARGFFNPRLSPLPNSASTFSASTSAARSLSASSTTATARRPSSFTTWNGAA